jgi:GAF domain-containing protein
MKILRGQKGTELGTYQSRSLALSLEPEVIGKNLIRTMDEMLGYEFASAHLLEDQSQSLVLLAISQQAQDPENSATNKTTLFNSKVPLGVSIIGWVAQHGQALRVSDVTQEERYFAVLKNIRSELCVPLVARGKVIGSQH